MVRPYPTPYNKISGARSRMEGAVCPDTVWTGHASGIGGGKDGVGPSRTDVHMSRPSGRIRTPPYLSLLGIIRWQGVTPVATVTVPTVCV
ncbi:hypothetical protein MMALV_06130 [Candidatus Methanomethylophilus alvi Mx1201]|uniref:Uncharacterized protein n=1 Tax=Methanomethylophilus alvi (strain Mx1201) TaxID=1236689 RepID=M9SC66_METAX|nr:hypothetical protein MMALV_06130 [Candidatus Methanomethylophilus alvi Mx1201]